MTKTERDELKHLWAIASMEGVGTDFYSRHVYLSAALVKAAPQLIADSEELERVTAELSAYKKAKAENDERFMTERDEARAECKRLDDGWDQAIEVSNGFFARINELEAELARTKQERDNADWEAVRRYLDSIQR